MPIPAFNLLSHDLVKAGVKTQLKHVTGSSWMKHVASVYHGLTPAQLQVLKTRAAKAPKGKINQRNPKLTVTGLPLNIECYAAAMGLPLNKVAEIYPRLSFHESTRFTTPLYTIAKRLKIKPPTRQLIQRDFAKLLKVRRIEQKATAAAAKRGILLNKENVDVVVKRNSAIANAIVSGSSAETLKALTKAPIKGEVLYTRDSATYYSKLAAIEGRYANFLKQVMAAGGNFPMSDSQKASVMKMAEKQLSADGIALEKDIVVPATYKAVRDAKLAVAITRAVARQRKLEAAYQSAKKRAAKKALKANTLTKAATKTATPIKKMAAKKPVIAKN